MSARFTTPIIAITVPAYCLAQPNIVERKLDWWAANGTVQAMELDIPNDRVYLGGDFYELVPPAITSYGCQLEAEGEGWPVLRQDPPQLNNYFNHVRPNNNVNAVVSDGAGGWYIGGNFTQVGGQPRARLAHILSNGDLDPDWQAGADGQVRALALHNGKLYVGGDFSNASLARNRIAAFHAVPGVPITDPNGYSNPVAEFNGVGHANNNQVRVIVPSGDLLYVGGSFTSMGGATCNRLIALDATTGDATSWAPNANGDVYAIALTDTTAMVGGAFTQMNSTSRARFAELSRSTGALTTFNPGASNTVWALALSGDTLFSAGDFTTFYGQPRTRLAAVKRSPAPILLNWDPTADNVVYSIVVESGSVRFSGAFVSAGNPAVERRRMAEVDRENGATTNWNPFASGPVFSIARGDNGIYAGGAFIVVGARSRNNIAALELTSGKPSSFNPDANDAVDDIELFAGNIYFVGTFTTVGGQTRNRAAAVDMTGAPLPLWQPDLNFPAYTMTRDGTTLYIGGSFTTVSGYSRNYLAALDIATGEVIPTWAPNAGGQVYVLEVNEGWLYAGGNFTNLGTPPQNRPHLGRFALGNETPDAWNPQASGPVYTIAFRDNEDRVYVGGSFSSIGASSRVNLAALDANSNNVDATWVCNANNAVQALKISGNTLYVGGSFLTLGGLPRRGIASVNATTGIVFPNWYETLNNQVWSIAREGELLIAGGDFTNFETGTPALRWRLAGWEVEYEDETTVVGDPNAVREAAAFPNPTSGPLTVALPAGSRMSRMLVLNGLGQVVSDERAVTADRYTLDLSGEMDGLYTVLLMQARTSQALRVIVQH